MSCNTPVTFANIYSTMLFRVGKKLCCEKCNESEMCLFYLYEANLGEKDQRSFKKKG